MRIFYSVVMAAMAASINLANSVANAEELLMTVEKSGSAQVVGLDIVSEAKASAIQVRFAVSGGEKMDLSKCLSALPKSHTGNCEYRNGVLTILVYSDQNELLNKGFVSIGKLIMSPKSNLKLKELFAYDAEGNSVKIERHSDSSDTRRTSNLVE